MKPVKKFKINFSILIFALLPLMTCLIICLKDGIHMDNVYLANSKWNDELFYYKMIEGIAKYNRPLGYYGYNGSAAKIGQFGPWSPILFIFYIIYAKIFGWSMLAPFHCNMLLMTIAMAIFACLVQPTRRQTLFICLSYCSCTIVTRFIFSNLPEISIFSLLIIFLGIAVKMYRQIETKFKISCLAALNIIAFLLVLMRPYWGLLFLIPGYFVLKYAEKKNRVLIEAALALISEAIYFYITNNFCAAYVSNIINTAWLELLFSSPLEGLYNIFYILISSIWRVLQGVGDGIIQGSFTGSIYALFILIIGYLIKMAFKASDHRTIFGIFAFSLCAMLMAVFYLYDINVGSRHIIGFILIFAFLCPLLTSSSKTHSVFLLSFVWIFCIRATDQYTYQIPERTAEKESALLSGYEELTNANIVDPSADSPWDNTIIWLYNDETPIDFTYLYALPEGIGINFYFKENVLAYFEELQPKYILTNIGEEVDLLCQQQQKELIAEYGTVHVWRLRQ